MLKLTVPHIQAVWMCTHLGVTVFVKLLIPEVRVQLDLVDSWGNLGILQQVLNFLDTEVGDTNGLDKTLLNQLLHLLPCVLYSTLMPVSDEDMLLKVCQRGCSYVLRHTLGCVSNTRAEGY